MYVITNTSNEDIIVDGVSLPPHNQYDIQHLTADMLAFKESGKLRILSGDEKLEERQADIKAMGKLTF